MGLSKTRGFPPNCGHWMGNMMINHEIMRNTWSTKWPTCRQSHMGIPPQRHRPATWKAYTKQQMESSRQMEEPAIMTWRCLELSKKGYNLKPCLFNVFNSRTLDDSGWGVLILGNSPIFSLQLCRSSILTFADYEHYFFLRMFGRSPFLPGRNREWQTWHIFGHAVRSFCLFSPGFAGK